MSVHRQPIFHQNLLKQFIAVAFLLMILSSCTKKYEEYTSNSNWINSTNGATAFVVKENNARTLDIDLNKLKLNDKSLVADTSLLILPIGAEEEAIEDNVKWIKSNKGKFTLPISRNAKYYVLVSSNSIPLFQQILFCKLVNQGSLSGMIGISKICTQIFCAPQGMNFSKLAENPEIVSLGGFDPTGFPTGNFPVIGSGGVCEGCLANSVANIKLLPFPKFICKRVPGGGTVVPQESCCFGFEKFQGASGQAVTNFAYGSTLHTDGSINLSFDKHTRIGAAAPLNGRYRIINGAPRTCFKETFLEFSDLTATFSAPKKCNKSVSFNCLMGTSNISIVVNGVEVFAGDWTKMSASLVTKGVQIVTMKTGKCLTIRVRNSKGLPIRTIGIGGVEAAIDNICFSNE